MPLKVNILILVVASAFSFGGFAHAQQQEDGRILYHVIEMEPVILTSSSLEGVENGRHVQVKLSINANSPIHIMSAAVSSEGALLGRTEIGLSNIPSVDLSSVEVFSKQDAGGSVIIEMRFGAENDCFVNDDGRGRLRLLFKKDEPVGRYKISYDTCEPLVERLE